MKKLLNIYNSASTVATLWMLSPLLPFAMFVKDDAVKWMPYAGMVIFMVFGVSITLFRKQKIKNQSWKMSDFIAYILVPGSLFCFFSVIAINTI